MSSQDVQFPKFVKIKKVKEEAVIPSYSKPGDAGLDITAISKEIDYDGNIVYKTGLAFEIPYGFVGLIFQRSSISKYDLNLANSVAVIDSGYRGEVVLKFKRTSEPRFSNEYEAGDRVGQLIILPFPEIQFVEVDKLSDTQRGSGGFGSTGK